MYYARARWYDLVGGKFIGESPLRFGAGDTNLSRYGANDLIVGRAKGRAKGTGHLVHDVTGKLVQLLELDVSKQRLDSTHIESNMVKFGRMKLMATAIRRFLVQVKRYDEGSYNALRKAIRARFEASDSAVFGWKTLDDEGVNQLRQSNAEDLAYLVERYRRNKDHNYGHYSVVKFFRAVAIRSRSAISLARNSSRAAISGRSRTRISVCLVASANEAAASSRRLSLRQ